MVPVMKLLNTGILYVSVMFLGLAAGCSSDPADVAGSYTVAVTNGEDGCEFDNFEPGQVAQGIGVTVTQSGEDVAADFGVTPAGILLDVVLGSHVFRGSVDGDDLNLKIVGTPSGGDGNCTYTINATVDATLDGDFLSGTIDYAAQTNGGTDCGAKNGCHTKQSFNGTRPPKQ